MNEFSREVRSQLTLPPECEPDKARTYPDPTDEYAVYAVPFEETVRFGEKQVFEEMTDYDPSEAFIRAVCHAEGRPREQIRFERESITAEPLGDVNALFKTEDERE